jgi:hypothetical protein
MPDESCQQGCHEITGVQTGLQNGLGEIGVQVIRPEWVRIGWSLTYTVEGLRSLNFDEITVRRT